MNRILFPILFLALLSQSCKKKNPLLFSDTTYDFKESEPGSPIKATFFFKNITNKSVLIEDISTECDCIVPDKKHFEVKPQTKDSLSITFLTSKELSGPQQREIIVRTNSQPNFYHLKIVGILLSPFKKDSEL